MESLNSLQLFELLKRSGVVGAEGHILLTMLDVKVRINDKSSIGNLIQEWFGGWLKKMNIYYRVNVNSQEFPDFYLSKRNDSNLLEIKSFDYTKAPNFDIANFDAYIRSIRTKAYRLDADYLIFGYTLTKGKLIINDVWLKKVWELTCPSTQFALRAQVKQNKIVNIRPYNFKNNSIGFQPFNDKELFILAIKNTLVKYVDKMYAENWFEEVQNSMNN